MLYKKHLSIKFELIRFFKKFGIRISKFPRNFYIKTRIRRKKREINERVPLSQFKWK